MPFRFFFDRRFLRTRLGATAAACVAATALLALIGPGLIDDEARTARHAAGQSIAMDRADVSESLAAETGAPGALASVPATASHLIARAAAALDAGQQLLARETGHE